MPVTGQGDVNTWMSLLLSKGNPDRTAKACDCSTVLNQKQAQALYNAGYRYIGRYLTGTVGGTRSKAMTKEEVQYIFNAGLRIFAIFQTGVPSLSRYTFEKGVEDAKEALAVAKKLGIPKGEFIYFAIDYDVMDGEVDGYVFPYFEGISSEFIKEGYIYRRGVYGARNICTRLYNKRLADSSFVSDMSTGFSGNMGYSIPKNWAFDQFNEYMFENPGGTFGLDKVAYSGRYTGFGNVTEKPPEPHTDDEIRMQQLLNIVCGSTGLYKLMDDIPTVKKSSNKSIVDMDIHLSDMAKFLGIELSIRSGIGVDVPAPKNGVTQEIKDGKMETYKWWNGVVKILEDFAVGVGLESDIGELSMAEILEFSKNIENGTSSYGISYDINKTITLYMVTKQAINPQNEKEGWTYNEIKLKIDTKRLEEVASGSVLAKRLIKELREAADETEQEGFKKRANQVLWQIGLLVILLLGLLVIA